MTGRLASERQRAGDSAPVRTCIGCRLREPRTRMVRLVAQGQTVSVCLGYRQGRGAWIHYRLRCWEKAQKIGAFSRALRQRVSVPSFSDAFREVRLVLGYEDLDESGLEADGHPMSTQR